MYTDLALYIDGKWLTGEGRKGEDVINPANGKVLAHLPHASKADLDHALAAAEKGFAVWKATSAYDRSKIMRKAADLLRERAEHVAKVQTQEQGKPFPESRIEVLTSADIIDWYAEEGRRAYGRIVPGRQKGVRQIVLQEPVGVVAAFTPWNFPTLTPVRKIAGALAAGCSLIIKASEEVPGGCVELVKCFADAGLPAGVLNLVFGVPAEVSEHLIPSPIVKKISFTGSIPVGKHLAGLAAKGYALEILSGDAPRAVEEVARALGIARWRGGLKPAEKVERLRALAAGGAKVLMVGDGINDAPALAAAGVGIAMGTGADVAIESAGITLLKGDLGGAVRARRLARATLRNIHQNLWFAFGYNAIGIPIAAGVLFPLTGWLLSPMIAAAAMALSSVSVIGNALRLGRAKL